LIEVSFNAMNAPSRYLQVLLWGVLATVLVLICILFARSQFQRSHLPELSEIQPFSLTNQLGQAVSLRDLAGKVWVADIIFTRCAGPCPKMTEEMSKLQNAFTASDPLRFVTLTTDPEHDAPSVLKTYGAKFGADPARWYFLTGSKPEIKNLAVGGLKLAAVEKEEGERQNENDLFIHSTLFVLIDKRGKMRAVYESLEPDFREKIKSGIQGLLRESP
jgi:protein SCO1/2